MCEEQCESLTGTERLQDSPLEDTIDGRVIIVNGRREFQSIFCINKDNLFCRLRDFFCEMQKKEREKVKQRVVNQNFELRYE